MKVSSEHALVTALVRGLSYFFHEMLRAKGAFIRCMVMYGVRWGSFQCSEKLYSFLSRMLPDASPSFLLLER